MENSAGISMDISSYAIARTSHSYIDSSYHPALPTNSNNATHVPSCLGHHLIVDLQNAKCLENLNLIEGVVRVAASLAGATVLNMHVHAFPNHGGVTCNASLAESHISLHTWPEYGYAALDIFMCGKCNPYACLPEFVLAFRPQHIEIQEIIRGSSSATASAG